MTATTNTMSKTTTHCIHDTCVTSQAAAAAVELPLTVNLHVTRACNFRCACCYAHFGDERWHERPMDLMQWGRIIDALAQLPPHSSGRRRKITFSGGEPTLLPYLPELISHCRRVGFTTSLITNGTRLAGWGTAEFGALDWLGVSIDSADPETLRKLGRVCSDGSVMTPAVLSPVFARARQAGCRIKINTVVSRLNHDERLGAAVAGLGTERWKVLQMMTVAGQNDGADERYGVTRAEFDAFVAANQVAAEAAGVTVVVEPVEAISGSYCMIAPNGCFFDDITGRHRYSRPILDAGVESAFGDVHFDPAVFEARGGSYA